MNSQQLAYQQQPYHALAELSRATYTHSIATPATTLSSNNSSQERAMTGKYAADIILDDVERPAQGLSSISNDRVAIATAQAVASNRDQSSAPKRLANGEIKSSNADLLVGYTDTSLYGHSRNSSMTSRSSQIVEVRRLELSDIAELTLAQLSVQLRTRLSYAMFKVQHGWQGENIQNLEQMASQRGSPASAASDRRSDDGNSTQSPPGSRRLKSRKSGQTTHPIATTTKGIPQQASDDTQGSATSSQAGTYESFWREHSSSAAAILLPTKMSDSSVPRLAPAVDILPRTRHADLDKRQPPPLCTNVFAQSANNAPLALIPSTPPRKPAATTRTPSQQAAVEKDAIETLLFMSSPGNSGHRFYDPLISAPLRTMAIAEQGTPTDNESLIEAPNGNSHGPLQSSIPMKRLSERDIDKMLDEMTDNSSDEEELLDLRIVEQLR